MAAARSPRSEAFQLRQARKARSLSDKAQDRLTPAFARGMSDYFVGLAERIEEALETGQKADPAYNLFSKLDADPFWNNEKDILGKVVQKNTIKAGISGVQGSRVFMGQATVFDLPNPVAKEMTWRIGRQITGINDETRQRVQKTIKDGIGAGQHPSVIARTLREQALTWAGLENLSASRAYTIARTETANAYNWGALLEYKRSGIVEKVVCHDAPTCGWIGHNGAELANGTHRTLTEAGNHPVSHPNCVRAFSPAFGKEEPGIRDRKAAPPPGMQPPGPGELDPALWANPKKFGGGGYYGVDGSADSEKWGDALWQKGVAGKDKIELNRWQRAASDYQGVGYRDMNAYMRGEFPNLSQTVQNEITDLEKYIDTMPIPDTVVVHRGIGSGKKILGDGYQQLQYGPTSLEDAAARAVGQTFKEEGFMSTALDSRASFDGVQLELTVPRGTPGLPMSNQAGGRPSTSYGASAMSEAELLLQRDLEYVIDRYEIIPSKYGGQTVKFYGRILPSTP